MPTGRRGSPHRLPGAEPCGTAIDAIDLHAAEGDAERARAELAEAQRIAHVGSWTYDPATDVSTWSDELYRIFGLPLDRPIPLVAESEQLYTPDSWARLNASLDAAVRIGTPYEIQLEIIRPDGEHRHCVAHGEAVRGPGGAVTALRGTFADVTELRETQVRLDQAQRAEMVGRLAGGVAHDFNNLLAAINGYADFLADAIPADDPMHGDVEAIQQAGSRAADLTRQLLAFGRRQTLRPTVLDVAEVITSLAPILRSLVGASVAVDFRLAADMHVRADRASLEQAVTNLVLNARDAMPADGRVTIATAVEVVAAGDPRLRPPAEPGTFVRISVTDTGAGIEPDVLPHVFEPFYTTKALGRGTGLGLSSVEGAVAQAAGFVTVESELGAGSTFSLHLPRAADAGAAAAPERQAARATPAGTHGTILIVEDEPDVRAVTVRALRDRGHSVVEAADGTLALAVAAASSVPFDVLVTDIVMPGMNGRELAGALLARFPGLRVIYMSGYAPETVFGNGLLPEGTPYLHKPFARADLLAQVEAAVERRPGEG